MIPVGARVRIIEGRCVGETGTVFLADSPEAGHYVVRVEDVEHLFGDLLYYSCAAYFRVLHDPKPERDAGIQWCMWTAAARHNLTRRHVRVSCSCRRGQLCIVARLPEAMREQSLREFHHQEKRWDMARKIAGAGT